MDWEEDLLRYGAFNASLRGLETGESEQRRRLRASGALGDPRRSRPEAPERSRGDAGRDLDPIASLERGPVSESAAGSARDHTSPPLPNDTPCAQFARELASYPGGTDEESDAVAARQALQIVNCACTSVRPFLMSALRAQEAGAGHSASTSRHRLKDDDIVVTTGALYIAFRFSLVESATNPIGHRSITKVTLVFLEQMLAALHVTRRGPVAAPLLDAWRALEVCCMLHFRENFACSFGEKSPTGLLARAELSTAVEMHALANRIIQHSMGTDLAYAPAQQHLEVRAGYAYMLAQQHLEALPKLQSLTVDGNELLGEGGFGQVTLRHGSTENQSADGSIDVRKGRPYAAKRVDLEGDGQLRVQTNGVVVYFVGLEVLLENLVWRRLSRAAAIAPYFVPLHGVFLEKEWLTFLSPQMISLEALYVNAVDCNKGGWSNHLLRCFTAHLFRGLQCLHALSFVHGDIKPTNLLLDSREGVLKINDFGLARPWMLDNHLGTHLREKHFVDADISRAGTSVYQAPELQLLGDKGVVFTSSSIDIWAAGTCVLYFATGRSYWFAMRNAPLAQEASLLHSSGRVDLSSLVWAVQLGGMPSPDSMLRTSKTWVANAEDSLPTLTPSGLASALEWAPRDLSSEVGLGALLTGALAPSPETRIRAFELCAAEYVAKALDRIPPPKFDGNGDSLDPSQGNRESFEQIKYDLGPGPVL